MTKPKSPMEKARNRALGNLERRRDDYAIVAYGWKGNSLYLATNRPYRGSRCLRAVWLPDGAKPSFALRCDMLYERNDHGIDFAVVHSWEDLEREIRVWKGLAFGSEAAT